jgi:mitochondrial ribonuclease P protein 3
VLILLLFLLPLAFLRSSLSAFSPFLQPLLQKWLNAGILYRTPPGMNDDWFWMHAALYCGPPGSSNGGAETNHHHATFVVTNDEMRDHHFQMLAQRSFVRWKDRHAIHFSFGDWIHEDANDKNARRRQVLLTYPEPYTRRIQRIVNHGLVIPLPKRGDENRFLDGSHDAPDDAPKEETYLCIRPKEDDE